VKIGYLQVSLLQKFCFYVGSACTSDQNMTSAACLACSGDHVRFIGGQSWLSFVCYGVRYSVECEYWQLWSV